MESPKTSQSCCGCEEIYKINDINIIDIHLSLGVCVTCERKPKAICIKCKRSSIKSTEFLCTFCIDISMKSTMNIFKVHCIKCKKLKKFSKLGPPSNLGSLDKILFKCNECNACDECDEVLI